MAQIQPSTAPQRPSAALSSIEPGLLRVFRLFVGVRAGVLLLLLSASMLSPNTGLWASATVLLGLLEAGLLLTYLSLAFLQRLLRALYLPAALAAATLGPIIEHVLALLVGEPLVPALAPFSGVWQLFLALMVPLVLIAWQYNFGAVLGFCAASGLVQVILVGVARRLVEIPTQEMLGSGLGGVVVRTLVFLLVGYLITRLVKAQREQRAALAEANRKLTRYATALEQLATSRERNRLARELHDTLAHTLSALSVQLQAVEAVWDNDPAAARARLGEAITATRKGLNESRRAIKALRAAPLEEMGLTLALRSLAETTAAQARLGLEVRIPQQVEGLSVDEEQCIYRVAEEALSNVARHAQAAHLEVALEHQPGQLCLTVRDDGRGFNMEEITRGGHFGLRGLQERADMVGGTISVKSGPGRGTTIRLMLLK